MSKKRKEPAQSSTLLDFFGKGCIYRDTKKVKVKAENPQSSKCDSPGEVIVIDSSDEDDVVEVLAVRPAPKPLQVDFGAPRHSAPADNHQSEVRHATLVLADNNRNIKSEPQLHDRQFRRTSSLLQHDPLPSTKQARVEREREPSPFGFPALLAAQGQGHTPVNVPPPGDACNSIDCSHDSHVDSDTNETPRDRRASGSRETLAVGDWDMGDDEVEQKLFDIDADVKVDIDLTLEDEETLLGCEQPAEKCPICERTLSKMSSLDINAHVDECLNAVADTYSASPALASLVTTSSKTLDSLTSLPAPLASSCDPIASSKGVKREDSDRNVFSTLMKSYQENEVWKEASTVEDTSFRPTKANGGRRKAPFYKVMQGMPIAVDAFRYGTIPNVSAYFLTHAHSDHYTNLSAKWDSGPIYCSQGTANLIIHMLAVDSKWVHPLPMEVATTIPNTGGVQVTLIEANHCPGSCLFLFEGKQTVDAGDSAYKSQFVGSSRVFRYLHCGDFRASPQHVLHPAIKGKKIDHVYLDTTYLDPKYCFPPQPLVISACAELAKRLVQGKSLEDTTTQDVKPRTMTGWFTRADKGDKGKEKVGTSSDKTLVVVGTYSIGKERIVKAIAKALDTKVYCDSRKTAILRCQSDPELHALLTTDPFSAGVHLVPLAVIATDRLKAYMERWKSHFTKAIGFRPTGWTYTPPNGTDTSPAISAVISRSQSRTFTHANMQPMRNSTSALQVYGVPYSEHSSFFELTCFALSLEWTRMIATVNVGSEASRGKMSKWVEKWEAERKKRGGTELVRHRADDYW